MLTDAEYEAQKQMLLGRQRSRLRKGSAMNPTRIPAVAATAAVIHSRVIGSPRLTFGSFEAGVAHASCLRKRYLADSLQEVFPYVVDFRFRSPLQIVRQNRAGDDAAATPRGAWLARQGDSAARPGDATASASWTAGTADRTRAVPARGCRADREVPAAAVASRFRADRGVPAASATRWPPTTTSHH